MTVIVINLEANLKVVNSICLFVHFDITLYIHIRSYAASLSNF